MQPEGRSKAEPERRAPFTTPPMLMYEDERYDISFETTEFRAT